MGFIVDTGALSSQATYTDGKQFYPGQLHLGITGFSASTLTIHVQRKPIGGATYYDVDSFTADAQEVITEPVGATWRCGILSGNYTGGSVTCTITQKPKPDIFD